MEPLPSLRLGDWASAAEPACILLADDDPADVEAARRAFREASSAFEVRAVRTIGEYHQAVAERAPNLAVIALVFPDGGGLDLLRLQAKAGSFPILIMTRYGDERTGAEAIKAGALDYIVKSPEAFAELPHTVGRALREWELRKQHTRAVEALQQSQATMRALIDGNPHTVALMDANSTILAVNQAFARSFGRPIQELIGTCAFDLFPPELAQARRAKVVEALATGRLVQFEETRYDRFFESFLQPVLGPEGIPTRVALLAIDITERKRAEAALRMERDLGLALAAATTLPEALQRCLESAIAVSGMDSGGVYRVLDDGSLDLIVHQGLGAAFVESTLHYAAGSARARLVRERGPAFFEHHELDLSNPTLQSEGLLSLATVPIDDNGRILACLNVASHLRDTIPETARLALSNVAQRIGSAVARARSEEVLREREARLAESQQVAGLGHFSLDISRGSWTSSDTLDRILGIGPEYVRDVAGWNTIVHPDDRHAVLVYFEKRVVRDRLPFDLEFRIERIDDRAERWVHCLGRLDLDENGQPVRMFGTIQDVTERKRAETALRRSERRFRALVEHSADTVTLLARDGTILFDDPTSERLTGFRPAERVGQNGLGNVHADDLPAIRAAFARLLSEPGGMVNAQFRSLRKDGTEWWTEATATNLLADRDVQAIVVNYRDITERKRAELALAEQARLQQVLIDGMPCVAFLLRPDSREIVASNKAAVAVGAVPGERCFTTWGQRADPCPWCRARDLWATGQVQHSEVEAWGAVWDVHWIPISANLYLHYAFDVTDRKRADVERSEMAQQLMHKQKLESLGILAGGVAHDFNNLLMAILGNLDIAALDLTPGAPAMSSIKRAIDASRRAAELTRQMLAYSGRGHFVVTRVDLGGLVRENVSLLRAAVPKSLTLEIGKPTGRAAIEADSGQIQQVVMNLVTNAAEAMGDKPGVIRLATGIVDCTESDLKRSRIDPKPAPGRFAFIEVADTGCGMDEATQEKLFDPFFSTKFAGRGLGMSVVLGIVRGRHGAILVDSAPDRGSTIRILFPACLQDEAEAIAPASPVRPLPVTDRAKILVVDDEDTVRWPCQRLCERLGFESLGASDGAEGLAQFARHADQIACVVLDLTMPEMDGVATFHALKRLRPDVRVILSSGYGEKDVVGRFGEEKPAAFLQKPYGGNDLRAKIVEALGGDSESSSAWSGPKS